MEQQRTVFCNIVRSSLAHPSRKLIIPRRFLVTRRLSSYSAYRMTRRKGTREQRSHLVHPAALLIQFPTSRRRQSHSFNDSALPCFLKVFPRP
jgi:hypothetical protein